LVAALQPPQMSPTAMETIFEAAWAITNLAVVRFGRPPGCSLRCSACCGRSAAHLARCPQAWQVFAGRSWSSFILYTSQPQLCLPLLSFPCHLCACWLPVGFQGEFEAVKAVLGAAPVLIAYLGGGAGPAVAEQCAWALGTHLLLPL
jgi:hypothetical protein